MISEILDEIAIDMLNLGTEISKQELTALKEKVKKLIEILKEQKQSNALFIAGAVDAIIERLIEGNISENKALKIISEEITLLQKLLQGKEPDPEKILQEHERLMEWLNSDEEELPSVEKQTQPSSEESAIPEEEPKMTLGEVEIKINPEEDPDLYWDFVNEGKEHLDTIEVNIINLEQNPEDKEVINTIFRPFHTIKGIAGFLGLEPINKLAHAAENMLDAARSDEFKITSKAIDVILEAVDMLKNMIEDVEEQLNSGQPTGRTFPVEGLIKKIEAIRTGTTVEEKTKEEVIEKSEISSEKAPSEGEELKVNFEEDVALYRDFISEAREHLSSIELNIINLEQNPTDIEVINSIFRPFHTIKGVSGFLGLDIINKLSHAAENMLDAARNDEFTINEQAVDVILEIVDVLKNMIDDLEEQISTGKPTGKRFPVQELIKKIEAVYMKQQLQSSTPEKKETSKKEVVSKEVSPKALEQQERRKEEPVKIKKALPKDQKTPAKAVAKAPKEQKRAKISQTIKIDTQKLDNLIDMIGELLITQSMIRQNPVLNEIKDQKLVRDLSQLARITTELQKISMSLRMVPIKETFQKMIRLVRDLSKKSGKKVQLVMQGEETEIDRNMVEELYDPLVHMIRNAVDHGIEMPEERRAKGKPEVGTIELLAYHKGGNIVIEIKDDGKGLDKEKILKKAIERGLVLEGEELSDAEIYQLIFKPGFSTAEKITDVSGRGVGMDVVKKTLEKLRGKIEIKSEKGKGTTFIIKLPLTLAIIDGIIVKVGNERYILPTIAVQEVFRPTKDQYNTYAEKGEMINIRNNLFPIVRLHRLFNVEAKYTKPWEALMVLVESEDERRCLMVDEVLGKQEVVIKSLGEALGRIKGIAGGAIMGDGRVGLILDVTGIFEMSEE